MTRIATRLCVFGLAFGTVADADAAGLPKGFAYLAAIEPTITEDIRYATAHNFTRAVVPGYGAAACVLARPTAEALARVQAALKPQGLGLKVFDCYRPARAVKAFVAWASRQGKPDPEFYPGLARDQLIAKGYIAARSGHSSGGTVDLALVRLSPSGAVPLDMGTGFDFFDPMSHTRSPKISAAAAANRRLLVDAMEKQGFVNYSREWWHFSYRAEPFKGRTFDFEITAAPR